MKGSGKIIWMLLLLLVLSGLLCACGEEGRQRGINGCLYVAEQIPLETSYTYLQEHRVQNGYLYYLAGGSLYRTPLEEDAEGGVQLGRRELVAEKEISRYTVDEASSVYYFQTETRLMDDGTLEMTGGVLTGKRKDGQEIFSRKFEFTPEEAEGLLYVPLAADGEGRIYLLAGDNVYVTDADGEPAGVMDIREYCTASPKAEKKLLEGAEGRVYYYMKDVYKGEMAAYEILWQGGRLAAERVTALDEGVEPGNYGDVYGSAAGLLHNYNGLLRLYRPGESSAEDLLRWPESDLGREVLEVAWVSEDKLTAACYTEGQYKLYLLTRRMVEELPEREELILVSINGSQRLDRAVAAFNQSSDKYHISMEVINRGSEEVNRLDARLVSSDPPDILDLTYMNMLKYANKQALEDLSPLLEEGVLPGKDSYVEGLIEAYTVDGKLVALPKNFGVEILLGRASRLGAKTRGWTMEELRAFVEENPGCRILEMDSFEYVLEELLADEIVDHYIDWEKGECDFDSDSFKELMSWLEEHTARVDRISTEEERNREELLPQDQLLAESPVYNLTALIHLEAELGSDMAVAGYPSGDGSVSYHAEPIDLLGIVSNSRHKEGAWEFLKFFLGSQEEDYTFGLPVYRDLMEQMFDEVQTEEYWYDSEGNLMLQDDEPILKPKFFYYIGEELVKRCSMTEEEADRMRDIIAAADFSMTGGAKEEILGIIMEEIRSYLYRDKTLEEVTAIIQSRVRTLVQEGM